LFKKGGRNTCSSTLIIPSPAAQALSLFQSILLSLGQSINHDNALYISYYYININVVHLALIEIRTHNIQCNLIEIRIPKKFSVCSDEEQGMGEYIQW
jgi:hypothetical protein